MSPEALLEVARYTRISVDSCELAGGLCIVPDQCEQTVFRLRIAETKRDGTIGVGIDVRHTPPIPVDRDFFAEDGGSEQSDQADNLDTEFCPV